VADVCALVDCVTLSTESFMTCMLCWWCRPEGKDYSLHRLILGTHT